MDPDDGDDLLSADELELELLCLIGEGAGSISRLLRIAKAIARNCQGVPPHVSEIAGIAHGSHCERDLHRWVQKQPWRGLLPDVFQFPVRVTFDGLHVDEASHACLLPHELFGSLYRNGRELWQHMFLGGHGDLAEFWEKSRASDWYQKHPVWEVAHDPMHAIPYGIYGDDAGVFQTEKILILLWGGVVEDHPTLISRLLFTAVPYSRVIPDVTLPEIYKVWKWSLTWLGIGEYPPWDHNGRHFGPGFHPDRARMAGNRIAGDFVGVFSEMRGDWKYLREALKLKQHYGANSCCHLCRAHKQNQRLLFTNFRRDSVLRQRPTTDAEFRRDAGPDPPEFLGIPGFHLWRVWVDAAHNFDLGSYQYSAASGIAELAAEGVWPAGTIRERWALAYADHKAWCKTRLLEPPPRFEYGRICRNIRCPVFSQLSAKGTKMKHIMEWLKDVCDRPGVSDTPYKRVRHCMFHNVCIYERIYSEQGRFLEPAALAESQDAMERSLVCLNYLCSVHVARSSMYYHIVPKVHMSTHLAYDFAPQANPRKTQAYADEDMVGRTKKIIQRCHGATAALRGLMRYCICAGVRWYRELFALRFPS